MLPANNHLSREELERLKQFDTCTLSNAIERLNIRATERGTYHWRRYLQIPATSASDRIHNHGEDAVNHAPGQGALLSRTRGMVEIRDQLRPARESR